MYSEKKINILYAIIMHIKQDSTVLSTEKAMTHQNDDQTIRVVMKYTVN